MSEQQQSPKSEMPGFFSKKYSAIWDVGQILEACYGNQPADIIAEHFSDTPSKTKLRQALDEQSGAIFSILLSVEEEKIILRDGRQYYGNSAERFARLESGKVLQERLDAEGIVLKPFASKVKDHPELSREQFYEQAIRFAYVLAEFAGECRKLQEQLEQEQHDKNILKEFMDEQPLPSELAQQVLKCDFPEGFLEWKLHQSQCND